MDGDRLRVSLEVWWLRWAGRLRTLARLGAVLAVAAGGADLVLVGTEIFTQIDPLVVLVSGLVAVLLLSALWR